MEKLIEISQHVSKTVFDEFKNGQRTKHFIHATIDSDKYNDLERIVFTNNGAEFSSKVVGLTYVNKNYHHFDRVILQRTHMFTVSNV